MIRRQAAAWLFGAFAKLSISPSSSPFSRVFPGQTGYAMPAVVVLIHGAGGNGMSRRIVLLSDGTGNSAAKVWRTNVRRTFEALDLSGNDQGRVL